MERRKVIFYIFITLIFLSGCTVSRRLSEKKITGELTHLPRNVVQQQQQQLSKQLYQRFEDAAKRDDSLKNARSSESIFDPTNFKKDGEGNLVASIDAQEVTVISKTRVLAERDGKVTVDFVITMPKDLQSAASGIVITPKLHRTDTTLLLEPIQLRGGLFGLLQERSYWRYTAIRDNLIRFRKGVLSSQDTATLKAAFEEHVKHPYLDGTRFDSIANATEKVSFYYTQQIDIKEAETRLKITLDGKVDAMDGSTYLLPSRDTISFNLSTMLFFIDTTTRYVKKVVERYAVVNDRNYLSFKVGKSNIIDTLGDNKVQLTRIKNMMDQMLIQQDYYIDTIVLSAAASPEGASNRNALLAEQRALSLEKYLKNHYNLPELDTLLHVRSIGENWKELKKLIYYDASILAAEEIIDLIDSEPNYDRKEVALRSKFPKEYKYIRENLYPLLRTVDFRYNLRRIGMIKDTIHTTEVDTAYMNALEDLKQRRYKKAGWILLDYNDYNGLITALSLNYNDLAYEKAVAICNISEDDRIWYMRAIACARVGKFAEGIYYYKKAVEVDDSWEFRGRLDPEISMLLYQIQN